MKKILKWLLPSNEKIAGYVADGIADVINNQTEREAQIAKIATLADKFTDYQKFVTEILVDGKISDDEKQQIAEKIAPIIDYIREKI